MRVSIAEIIFPKVVSNPFTLMVKSGKGSIPRKVDIAYLRKVISGKPTVTRNVNVK